MSILSASSSSKQLGTQPFTKFSTWASLNRSVARLVHIIDTFRKARTIGTPPDAVKCGTTRTVEVLSRSKSLIIRGTQEGAYVQEISCVKNREEIPRASPGHFESHQRPPDVYSPSTAV